MERRVGWGVIARDLRKITQACARQLLHQRQDSLTTIALLLESCFLR
jgi:hypothetical protein